MKKTQILSQSHELSNDFNNEQFLGSLKSRLGSLAFRELINGQKHSMTLEIKVYVNEEEEEDMDPDVVRAMNVVKMVQKFIDKMSPEELSKNFDMFRIWREIGSIDLSRFINKDKNGK